jgi:hypothetical protein
MPEMTVLYLRTLAGWGHLADAPFGSRSPIRPASGAAGAEQELEWVNKIASREAVMGGRELFANV